MRQPSLVRMGTAMAVAGLANAVINIALSSRDARRRRARPPVVTEPVRVRVPARDEEAHVETTVRSILAQEHVTDLSVTVLDDGSTDATPQVLAAIADERLTVRTEADEPPPDGWLGKPWACMRLADGIGDGVVVFVDADVVLAPQALSVAVGELRAGGYAMVAPFPREVAVGMLERLVQPLLNWVLLTTLPLGPTRATTWPPLSAANGQLLVFDATSYQRIGGHAAVRGEVVEDIAIMHAIRTAGMRATPMLGADLASCRMYDTPTALVDGYAKNLWSAFGGPAGSLAVAAFLSTAYLLPPLALLAPRVSRRTRMLGAVGTAAAVANRAVVARATGERVTDAVTHPVSVAVFLGLNVVSWSRHLRGTNRWKGRPVT